MFTLKRSLSLFVGFLMFVLCFMQTSTSAAPKNETGDVSHLMVPEGVKNKVVGAPKFLRKSGTIEVWIHLKDAPLAIASGRDAKRIPRLHPRAQQNYLRQVQSKQDLLISNVRSLGGQELGRVSKALNAVAVSIDASKLSEIAALPNVQKITVVRNYELDLGETVPYIGAAAVQSAGFDGSGVSVAVLDSGIDYTHKNFGGPGTAAAYTNAYGTTTADSRNKTLDGLFPTGKVVGGFDFVGEVWPTAPLAPDPDPIDCGPGPIPPPCAGGHGSHVADIIGGRSTDGTHKGVAPGVSLYAVKVCSAVSTSCSGVALLQGIDFALDPNGDGDISDAVDVINMSLGSPYGQKEDDLSEASANAVRSGIVVVASAGNSGDRPYITGSPSSTPELISVAQTHVPSAFQNFMEVLTPAAIAGNKIAVYQPWSPELTSVITAPLQYGNGAGGNLNGCAAFPAGSLAGKIVLVDRGVCAFSMKGANVSAGGGLVAVIGLVAPGAPFEGAFGGGTVTVPTFMISQADSNAIKGQLPAPGVTAEFDPANGIPLAGDIVATSSRGPNYSYNAIKPEIGAPGASVSAQAGTGTGETSFGGTSGASPMVAGSVALLLDANPTRPPSEIKSVLMNTAETNIFTDSVNLPGELAPITRIGGGEVRVNNAFNSGTAAWDKNALTGSLSFGYNALFDKDSFVRTVRVRNYTNNNRTYSITSTFRYANDAASGAVSVQTPSSIQVNAKSSKTFEVKLKVDPSKLPVWNLNGGPNGGDGFLLQGVEFDGYIYINGGTNNTVHLPWQILPHRAAAVEPDENDVELENGTGVVELDNDDGAVDGRVEIFALTGTSGKIPSSQLPQPGDNFAVIDLKSVGVRQLGSNIQFGINTNGERSHPNYPAEFDIVIDANRDGTDDYVIFNRENGAFASTGQNVVAAISLLTNSGFIFFFTDADLDSANAILTAPLSVFGGLLPGPPLTATTQFDFDVFAFDNYFTGFQTDSIENMTFTLGTPRFVGSGIPATGVPAGGESDLTIQAVAGGDAASPSQTGLLLLYRDGTPGDEADRISVNQDGDD